METKELTTHQRGIILRGISGGAALKGKSPTGMKLRCTQ